MRILGLDFGDRRIGIAISDKLLLTAQALGCYHVRGQKKDAIYFKNLVQQYEIGEIVIGLPLRMDGTQGTRVEKTKKFASWLEKTLKLPVVFWDERLTTRQALQVLGEEKGMASKKKRFKDQVSAALILSCYLESRRLKQNDG